MNNNLYIENTDFKQIPTNQIRKALPPLTTFAFQEITKNSEHWVTIESPEYTSICPFSDYPDFGTVKISYVPNKKCLELKSFKLYINAFRDVKIFHETVTEVIFADFLKAVKPKKAKICVDMNVRGNVKTICEKFYKCSEKA